MIFSKEASGFDVPKIGCIVKEAFGLGFVLWARRLEAVPTDTVSLLK
jgi:hypothetical protein